MLEVLDKEIKLETLEDVKLELGDYLETYVRQYNRMVETYEWLRDKITGEQRWEWERTIRSLKTVCLALDAGFDPCTPPRNWSSGQLVQYVAPIPEHVREAIDKAEPIFSQHQILIYDPNPEHFRRPRKVDPMAVGFVDLASQRLHFLIGQWDLDADLKFIKGQDRDRLPITRASRQLNEVITITQPPIPIDSGDLGNNITYPYWTTYASGGASITGPYSTGAGPSKWVAGMVGDWASKTQM